MQDVTERFKRSCAGLPDGRLVKMQGLGMLEAMNALQIGDPKMDTGVASSSNQQIYNPNISLSAEEVCWVIDHMTALEVAWYRGATLCQTVFTCIPCHKPELFAEQQGFVEQALRSYIYAYLKTIELAYAELSKGHVLDGEDVWLDHYGLPIEMFDDVDTILQEMDRGAHWALESNDPWMFELGKRFRVRAGIIRVLLAKSVDPPECDLTFTLNPGRAASLFDENMSRYLRQNMPLPTLSVPSHEEALNSIFEMFQDIRFAHVEELQELLWARHRRGPHLPLVRSVFKSTIMSKDSDWLFEEYIARQTGVIHVLHLMSEEIQDTERRQFTIWRDLVRGFYLNTCCVPLANPCRRRRIYLSLSSSWHERAVMAARFSGHNAPKVATALEALRLDCLLEAALGSWELELIAPSEEQCMWWWATCVAKQRAELQLKTSRQGEWACLWAEVGAAMQKVSSFSKELMKVVVGIGAIVDHK
ncbi:Mak10 subunit, NatC N-terminal acetyltransferase-domain-containing protein [Naematelia encephala]|uniref:Mak10 subunit, NatC N-terminal acetyltransferase-domain-containing protein n=1 Tax=Naematelia encephala TaxID=71784 RepID=A0A1Y2BJ28_9TREE|nr:Mak10 subunit, NatC N-terminal acetyltransferase-domain-containing protein [Naematelia encephala]